jgi:leader peptidase (prepilin peptidase)/N-methyltransferase
MTPTPSRAILRSAAYAACLVPLLRWLILAHTVPHGQPLRRRCPRCPTPLWPAACRPSARCPGCNRPAGPPPYTVEAAVAAAATLLTWAGARGWELTAYTTWATLLITLGFIDATTGRLPHRLTTAATLTTVALLTPAGADAQTWLTAAGAAAGLAALHGALHLAGPAGLGLGDVGIAVPIGLALGWHSWHYPIAALLAAYTAAVLAFTTGRLAGRPATYLPLGPYLAVASIWLAVAAYSG